MTTDRVASWVEALLARHTGDLTRPELLKAIRALSARYVERRAELPSRSPIDSAGKRAAFAVLYAPLHFVTADLVIRALGEASRPRREILDLGCGTGVASAAWALAAASSGRPALIAGVDRDRWALDEARWNWRALGRKGRATPGDLVGALEKSTRGDAPARGAGLIMGWSAN
jgi:methylase of polypeptide subunit release factors